MIIRQDISNVLTISGVDKVQQVTISHSEGAVAATFSLVHFDSTNNKNPGDTIDINGVRYIIDSTEEVTSATEGRMWRMSGRTLIGIALESSPSKNLIWYSDVEERTLGSAEPSPEDRLSEAFWRQSNRRYRNGWTQNQILEDILSRAASQVGVALTFGTLPPDRDIKEFAIDRNTSYFQGISSLVSIWGPPWILTDGWRSIFIMPKEPTLSAGGSILRQYHSYNRKKAIIRGPSRIEIHGGMIPYEEVSTYKFYGIVQHNTTESLADHWDNDEVLIGVDEEVNEEVINYTTDFADPRVNTSADTQTIVSKSSVRDPSTGQRLTTGKVTKFVSRDPATNKKEILWKTEEQYEYKRFNTNDKIHQTVHYARIPVITGSGSEVVTSFRLAKVSKTRKQFYWVDPNRKFTKKKGKLPLYAQKVEYYEPTYDENGKEVPLSTVISHEDLTTKFMDQAQLEKIKNLDTLKKVKTEVTDYGGDNESTDSHSSLKMTYDELNGGVYAEANNEPTPPPYSSDGDMQMPEVQIRSWQDGYLQAGLYTQRTPTAVIEDGNILTQQLADEICQLHVDMANVTVIDESYQIIGTCPNVHVGQAVFGGRLTSITRSYDIRNSTVTTSVNTRIYEINL